MTLNNPRAYSTACDWISCVWRRDANKLVFLSFGTFQLYVNVLSEHTHHPHTFFSVALHVCLFFCGVLQVYLNSEVLMLVQTILFMLEMKESCLNPLRTSLPQQIHSDIPLPIGQNTPAYDRRENQWCRLYNNKTNTWFRPNPSNLWWKHRYSHSFECGCIVGLLLTKTQQPWEKKVELDRTFSLVKLLCFQPEMSPNTIQVEFIHETMILCLLWSCLVYFMYRLLHCKILSNT